ncbi:unnamed protein product [Lactuca saligna]|uniref:Uncharacterized protein n=1 Tax=Lactuca saligna TaxID=75948 RepID=A0AA35YBN3_LACSI|nr:unnamed protein product [Lactuca saligna]
MSLKSSWLKMNTKRICKSLSELLSKFMQEFYKGKLIVLFFLDIPRRCFQLRGDQGGGAYVDFKLKTSSLRRRLDRISTKYSSSTELLLKSCNVVLNCFISASFPPLALTFPFLMPHAYSRCTM